MLESKVEEAESEVPHAEKDTRVVIQEQEEVGFSCWKGDEQCSLGEAFTRKSHYNSSHWIKQADWSPHRS